MKKEVDTIDDAEALVENLMLEDKWAITVFQNDDGKFLVQWMVHKMYTAQDGIKYRDEVWTTREGEMLHIQDLSADHAKNILRMIIRQDREFEQNLSNVASTLMSAIIAEGGNELVDTDYSEVPPKHMLH